MGGHMHHCSKYAPPSAGYYSTCYPAVAIPTLSRRDEFAKSAMAEFIEARLLQSSTPFAAGDRAWVREQSYLMADAMIAESGKK
jgi:hypothetical protein